MITTLKYLDAQGALVMTMSDSYWAEISKAIDLGLVKIVDRKAKNHNLGRAVLTETGLSVLLVNNP